jgi:hypothetical protein
MYYEKKSNCWRLGCQQRKEQDPDPEPLVRGTGPRIWIRTRMSRIQNSEIRFPALFHGAFPLLVS